MVSENRPNKKGKMVNKESRPWSDLHQDILCCIAARLGLADQIRSRSVCKNWSQIRGIKPNDRFPWLFAFDNRLLLSEYYSHVYYYLYDLSNRRSYTVRIRDHSTKLRFLGFDENGIDCINSDWLLLSPKTPDGVFFLFNPFTQEVVDIPPVPTEAVDQVFTFGRAAKSGRFVVYATVRSAKYSNKISIFEWEDSGGRDMERSDFASEFPGREWIYRAKCVGEDLCCLFNTGAVGVFNRGCKSWSPIVRSCEGCVALPCPLASGHPIELRGELFVVKHRENWGNRSCALRLDRSSGVLARVRLRECALFFSGFLNRYVMCREDSGPTRSYICSDCVSGVVYEEFGNDADRSDGGDRFGKCVVDGVGVIDFPWWHGKPLTNRYSDHWVETPTL